MKSLTDNPELVRHVRCATRKGKPAIYCTLFLLACLACLLINLWARFQMKVYASPDACFRGIFFQIIGANFVFLLVFGTHACAESVARERQTKTLDFQRITGMSSYWLALGKIVGVPFVHYRMALVGMPVTFLCVLMGGVSFAGYLISYLLLLASGLFFNSLGVLGSSLRREVATRRTSPIVFIFLLLWVGPFLLMSLVRVGPGSAIPSEVSVLTCLFPISSLRAVARGALDSYQIQLFRVDANGILMTFICNGLLFLFCWSGAARRMADDSQPLWARWQLLAFSFVFCAVLAGVVRNVIPGLGASPSREAEALLSGCTVGAHALAVLVAAVAAPYLYPYRSGLRRKLKSGVAGPRGKVGLPLFDDRAMAFPIVAAISVLYAATMLLVMSSRYSPDAHARWFSLTALFFLPFLMCSVVYTALAQLSAFFAPQQGMKLYALAIFIWALIPLAGGAMLLALDDPFVKGPASKYAMAVSPIGICIVAVNRGIEAAVASLPFGVAVCLFAAIAVGLSVPLLRLRRKLLRDIRQHAVQEVPDGQGL